MDNFDANTKKLVLVQIIFSSILGILSSLFFGLAFLSIIFCFRKLCKGICGDEEQDKNSEKNEEKNVDIVEEYKLEEINMEQTDKRSINS